MWRRRSDRSARVGSFRAASSATQAAIGHRSVRDPRASGQPTPVKKRAAGQRRMVAPMLGALTVPPAEDEVARAAARISEGALGDATVAPWPQAHDHHAYLLTARDGCEYLFKAARMRHPGR